MQRLRMVADMSVRLILVDGELAQRKANQGRPTAVSYVKIARPPSLPHA